MTGRWWKWTSSHAATAGPSVPVVAELVPAMIGSERHGASSSCRSGAWPCSSCMRCGGWIVRSCGVKVERVPWAEGKNQLTTTYQVFLARWAKLLSWKQVARAFRTTWDNVFRSVKTVVAWGLAHRSLEGIEAIGVDEVQWQKGHKYLTLVYQIDQGCRRLLWIGKDRTAKTFLGFFRMLGRERVGQPFASCAATCGKPF